MDIKSLKQIDPYRTQLDKTDNLGAKGVAKKGEGAPTQPLSTGDKVSLSREGLLRTEAFSAAINAPDIRRDKVDAIKAKIDSGEYTINSRAIAAKLLEADSELMTE